MDIGVEISGISKAYGSFPAVKDVSLKVRKGSFVSLLGPSGCGKTTTLRMIAGLETPDSGEIRVAGAVVFSSKSGVVMPPHRRRIGFVFQNYALWPHMTVAENLAYPLKMEGLAKEARQERVKATLEILKGAHLSQRYPGELSGGQQQRVALGRAIINPENQVILFDEPLSNLDAKLREELRTELRALQEDLGFTAIYVTHDQTEAMSMSDEIVIMGEGRIDRTGTPSSVYHHPTSRYAVDFFGVHNVLQAEVVDLGEMQLRLKTPVGVVSAPRPETMTLKAGDSVHVALPINAIAMDTDNIEGRSIPLTVVSSSYYGDYSDVRVAIEGGFTLRCRVTSTAHIKRGQALFGTITAPAVVLER